LSAMAWSVAGTISGILLAFLEIVAAVQGEMTRISSPTLTGTALALLGAFLLLLPRGMPGRWIGLFLLTPLFLPPAQDFPPGATEVDVLDVGQGTSVLVNTSAGSLLYDSGPGDGAGRDMVASAIVPALNRLVDLAPARIVISHGDQDHAGGLGSLRARFPTVPINANLPRQAQGIEGCYAGMRWSWRETLFTVLHPTSALPYQGNDSS